MSPEHIQALKHTFRVGLEDINTPNDTFDCRDLQCSSDLHIEHVDEYSRKVLSLLEECVKNFIPAKSSTNSKRLPEWKNVVKPIKDDLDFCHSIWSSAGKPVNCQLHSIYRNLRHQYHYSIRKLKNYKQEKRNASFLTAATSGKVNDILMKNIENAT